MTPEERTLLGVVHLLESLEVPYMVVGSVASSHHGRPRATHDADIVIDPTPNALDRLVGRLEQLGYYVNRDRAREALSSRRQFNVIDVESAAKIDLILRKDRAFSREEFERRRRTEISEGVHVDLATAEDTIVSKLEWARRAGESEKQLADASGILDVSRALDRDYVARWAEELGVGDLWERVSRPCS